LRLARGRGGDDAPPLERELLLTGIRPAASRPPVPSARRAALRQATGARTGHGTEGGQRTVETTSAMDRQVTRTVIRKGPKSKAPGRGSRTDGSRRTFPGTGTAFFSGPPTVCSKNQPFS